VLSACASACVCWGLWCSRRRWDEAWDFADAAVEALACKAEMVLARVVEHSLEGSSSAAPTSAWGGLSLGRMARAWGWCRGRGRGQGEQVGSWTRLWTLLLRQLTWALFGLGDGLLPLEVRAL